MSIKPLQHNEGVGSKVSNPDGSMGSDAIFGLLSSDRRRTTIQVLFERKRIDFSELVDAVAELELARDISEIRSDERHKVYVSLQQTHVPRLENEDIIERLDDGTIVLGSNACVIRTYLSGVEFLQTSRH